MEQSGSSVPPTVLYLPGKGSAVRWVRSWSSLQNYRKIVPNPGAKLDLITLLYGPASTGGTPASDPGAPVAFAVGPERGWTDGEVQAMGGEGWEEAGMGEACIRAENAAVIVSWLGGEGRMRGGEG
jgi:16S rRNA U1498 N3-methylase RsmE